MTDTWATFTVDDLGALLTFAAAVLILAVAAVRLSVRTGLPSLLLYLLIGIVLGDAGLGLQFESMNLARVLNYLALIIILAEGGLTTTWSDIKDAVAPAAVLSTVGVAVSILAVAVAAHFLLALPWILSLLIGAILSSTDAAAVFSVLRNVRPKRRLSSILEAESGFNDAPVVLLVVALSDTLSPQVADPSPPLLLGFEVGAELVGGAVVGVAVGFLASRLMRYLGSAASGLFPIGILAWILFSYGLASLLHSSGFLAVYLCGLVLGNTRLPHRTVTRGFAQALGWLAQIGLFVMLGLLASPDQLLPQLGNAIVLGLFLLFFARPLSVFASVVWFRVPWREQAFLSWAGLRGAVPIVLATVPVIVGVPGVTWIFNLVFLLVVVFTLLQAPPLPYIARRLRVLEEVRPNNVDIDAIPIDEANADLLDVVVGENSRLHGVEVVELRLPGGADVSLIIRNGTPFVPEPSTQLRHGDECLLICPEGSRAGVEARLMAIDEFGRLAGWGASRDRWRPRLY